LTESNGSKHEVYLATFSFLVLFANLPPETENADIKKIYETCDAGPDLQSLDKFRSDGLSCLSFYTYPAFFAEEWKRMMTIQETEKKLRQRARKSVRSSVATKAGKARISQIRVKKYNSEGSFIS
jgi:hypothetical protein